MKWGLIVVGVAAMIAGVAAAAYSVQRQVEHQQQLAAVVHVRQQVVADMTPHVKLASEQAANCLHERNGKDAGAAWQALAEDLDASITRVDAERSAVQAMSNARTAGVVDPALDYLRAIRDFLWAVREEAGANAALGAHRESLARLARDQAQTTRPDEIAALRTRLAALLAEQDALDKALQHSSAGVTTRAWDLSPARQAVKDIFPADTLLPVSDIMAGLRKRDLAAAPASQPGA
jgi:transposase-like protein